MAKKLLPESRTEPALFTFIGIACHLKDYRLIFQLNSKTEYQFVKFPELLITLPKAKEPSAFSFYYYRDDDHFNTLYLLSNRSDEFVLVPEMKQIDFILIIEGEFRKPRKDKLLEQIGTIPQVLMTQEMKVSNVKNYENLLTEIELQLMHAGKT